MCVQIYCGGGALHLDGARAILEHGAMIHHNFGGGITLDKDGLLPSCPPTQRLHAYTKLYLRWRTCRNALYPTKAST